MSSHKKVPAHVKFADRAMVHTGGYPAVKRLSPYDHELSDTFDKWLKQETKRLLTLEACGFTFKKVSVYSHEIAEYCRKCGFNADSAARGVFAVVKAYLK